MKISIPSFLQNILYPFIFFILSFSPILLWAQGNYQQPSKSVSVSPVQLANLIQDVELLRTQIGQLNHKITQLNHENETLKTKLLAQEKQQLELRQEYVNLNQLNRSVETLRQEWEVSNMEQKKVIINEITLKINDLTGRFNRSMQTLAASVDAQPKVPQHIQFSEDYPKTGIPYVVKSGDTLSEIARKHRSIVKDIQNANKIARPSKDLKVGQTIFIPQK